jgi:isopenicillin N synthase-like dioxygenase
MFDLSKAFFSLPETEKDPYLIDKTRTGYVGSFKDKNKDDKESMYFGGVRHGFDSSTPSIPPFWYQHLDTIEKFRATCHELTLKLLRCFAISFGLHPEYFAKGHQATEPPGSQLRMLHYPARVEPPDPNITRLIAHSDSQSITLLFQRNPGLDVLSPSGKWVRAPCWDDHILVNIGDALQFWSGNQLKSTMHRVTFEGLPHDQARYSMAYFCGANNETKLTPLVGGEVGIGWDGKSVGTITAGEYFSRQFDDLYGSLNRL